MVRKKKPGEDQRNKSALSQDEDDKQSIFQDAQGPLPEADLAEIIKQLLQQQTASQEASSSTSQPIPQTQGMRQTRSQTRSGSSTPKPESSTPINQSQTQGLISKKPLKPEPKTIDSYVKKLPS